MGLKKKQEGIRLGNAGWGREKKARRWDTNPASRRQNGGMLEEHMRRRRGGGYIGQRKRDGMAEQGFMSGRSPRAEEKEAKYDRIDKGRKRNRGV